MKIIGALLDYTLRIISCLRLKYILNKCASHGKNCHIDGMGYISAKNLHMGHNVYIGPNATLLSSVASIYIGNYVMIGPNVTICTGNHRTDVLGKYMYEVVEKRPEDDADVIIEDDVWLGAGCTILKGVTIGTGSVVAAGAVVTKNVPPYSIVKGVPEFRMDARWDTEKIAMHEQMLMERRQKMKA